MQRKTKQIRSMVWAVGMVMAGLLAGCGGGDGVSGGAATAQPGTLSVSLTDAPACGYDRVNVTVSKVRVHQSSTADEHAGGWVDLDLATPRKINLLDLNDPTQVNGALESLGEVPLAAGHYNQVRLVLVPNTPGNPNANSIELSGTPGEIALKTPSAVQSGVKLIHPFDVGSGQRVDLVLDFDACKSIVKAGNSGQYMLKPVIKVIPYVLNGIEGFVDSTLLASQVTVSAQSADGTIVRKTVPNTTSGKFFLARLPHGTTYSVVVTAPAHTTKVIAGVPVDTSTSVTQVSTSSAPLAVPSSGTHVVSGTVTLNPADDDATVVVAAKQVLSGGPTVTVGTHVAVLSSGGVAGDYTYDLTVPIARPWLGAYPADRILPVVFSEQPLPIAGAYTIQGSAWTSTLVYTTQAPSPLTVSVSGSDVPGQDFSLKP